MQLLCLSNVHFSNMSPHVYMVLVVCSSQTHLQYCEAHPSFTLRFLVAVVFCPMRPKTRVLVRFGVPPSLAGGGGGVTCSVMDTSLEGVCTPVIEGVAQLPVAVNSIFLFLALYLKTISSVTTHGRQSQYSMAPMLSLLSCLPTYTTEAQQTLSISYRVQYLGLTVCAVPVPFFL
jgi:hypothetical protein